MSQLQRDLRIRTQQRAHLLIEDTLNLYEMAGLSSLEAAQTLADTLITALVAVAACGDVAPDELGTYVSKRLERHRAESSQYP